MIVSLGVQGVGCPNPFRHQGTTKQNPTSRHVVKRHQGPVLHPAHQQLASSSRLVLATSSSGGSEVDADFQAALNDVSNKVLKVMLSGDKTQALDVLTELDDLRIYLLEELEPEAAAFIAVLLGMMNHTILKKAADLKGLYAQAFNRLMNQVQGSEWKLIEEGKSEVGNEEPKFSTWDDVLNGNKSSSNNGTSAALTSANTEYYQLLGVAPGDGTSTSDIKSAYRKLALKLHPDVNNAPDASTAFGKVVEAYDVLSDPTSRALYDKYGPDGMKKHAGYGSGRGNASTAWDEFKPHKRENKRTRARDASRTSYTSSMDEPGSTTSGSESDPQDVLGSPLGRELFGVDAPLPGDVVEYPLSDLVKADLRDGRSHGVALLVGRNVDRGDVKKLPAEVLDLCEVEPLRQEEAESHRWISDELSPSAYVRIGDLRKIAITSFDPRWDVWVIDGPLSQGCGGPDLGEEIMV